MEPTPEQLTKLENLKTYLKSLGSLAVGFSGGVDSTFLLYVAKEVLGNKAMAVTAKSSFCPHREMAEAEAFCAANDILQVVFDADENRSEEVTNNPPNRCYLCKKAIFSSIKKLAAEKGIEYVAEGSNMDDLGDYRPGLQAVAEMNITSPLREAKLTKSDIRALSSMYGLPTWNKPSYACLASRFVYGEKITDEKLSMVDKAEQLLLDLGFSQMRVRIHGDMARIEVLPEDISKLVEERTRLLVAKKFKELGFSYVSMDLIGYRTGSMNEVIL